MARVLYGVMGNTNGHIMRTLAIVHRLKEHEFYFVGGGRVPEVLNGTYPILEVPVLRTKHKNGRLDLMGTIGQILQAELQIPRVLGKLNKLVQEWKPDLAITDREFYLPIYSKLFGLPCLSIDHTHILKACHFEIPPELQSIWRLTLLNDYSLFNFTKENLIVSFFQAPKKVGNTDQIFSSVLRPEVQKIKPVKGDYIFVYLSIPHFDELLRVLRQQSRRVIVYGQKNPPPDDDKIIFRPYHPERILEDLAGSAYAVVNGGHNLICEALYYQKPVLCFPIAGLVEQYINVSHIRKLDYGDYTYDSAPPPSLFEAFSRNLDRYEKAITTTFRDGTEPLLNHLRKVILEKATGCR